MADVSMDASSTLATMHGMRNMVFVTQDKGYFFFRDADTFFKYVKTTDGGRSWSAVVTINGTDALAGFDVWFDQWTPGNKDSIIHIWWFGTTGDKVFYQSFNTTNDVIAAAATVFTGVTSVSGRGVFVSGARMKGGKLFCAFDIDAGAEHGTYSSADNGVTWTSRTDIVEATIDQAFAFPGNEADTNDCWFLYHDASTDELTLKVYDDSADTVAESSVIQSLIENVTDGTGQYGFNGSIRHSDGHLIVAAMSEYDPLGATADLQVFDINGTASITTKTDIATNTDDCYYPTVFINNKNDDIYVAYIGKTDGSETLGSSASVYYAKSTDRGTSWTKDVLYSATGSNWKRSQTPLNGARFIVNWIDNTTPQVWTNHTNSIDLGLPKFNNYLFTDASSTNTGILSVTEKLN